MYSRLLSRVEYLLAPALLLWVALHAVPAAASADNAVQLRARYLQLQPELAHNPYQRPLHIDSHEKSNLVRGDVYARIDHPYATVAAALAQPATWCDILILHLNTKSCQASSTGPGTRLGVHMGRKFEQPLEDTYRVDFGYRVTVATSSYLEIKLGADDGPLGTHGYQIGLEAIPLESGQTFLHFTYAYAQGMTGQLAMKGYLATLGHDKVGFTTLGKAGQSPRYVDGTLGAVERNAMRYYLAIETYLGALNAPPEAQLEKRLQDWFDATERYPRQLHEIDREDYLAMKRKEYARQQSGLPAEK